MAEGFCRADDGCFSGVGATEAELVGAALMCFVYLRVVGEPERGASVYFGRICLWVAFCRSLSAVSGSEKRRLTGQ